MLFLSEADSPRYQDAVDKALGRRLPDDLTVLGDGKSIGNVTALLLADVGYAPSNPPGWITGVRPQYVLLSVGAGDEHTMLDPQYEAFLSGYTMLRTDKNGWIHLSMDGEELWVEVERR